MPEFYEKLNAGMKNNLPHHYTYLISPRMWLCSLYKTTDKGKWTSHYLHTRSFYIKPQRPNKTKAFNIHKQQLVVKNGPQYADI